MRSVKSRAWALGVSLALVGGGLAMGSIASAAEPLMINAVRLDTSVTEDDLSASGFLTSGCSYEVDFSADPSLDAEDLLVKLESPSGSEQSYSGPGIDGREFETTGPGDYTATIACDLVREGWGMRVVEYDFTTYQDISVSDLYTDFVTPTPSGGPDRLSLSTVRIDNDEALLVNKTVTVGLIGEAIPPNAAITSRVWTSPSSIWSEADETANANGAVSVVNDSTETLTSFTIPSGLKSRWVWVSLRIVEPDSEARILTAGPYLIVAKQPKAWVTSYGKVKTPVVAGKRATVRDAKHSSVGQKKGAYFTYTWRADGQDLLTTSANYYPTAKALRGKVLTVRVTSFASGYTMRSKVLSFGKLR